MNNRNTQGEAYFVRDMGVYAAPVDDDPLRGSLVLSRSSFIEGAEYQVAQAATGTVTDAGTGSAFAPSPAPETPPPETQPDSPPPSPSGRDPDPNDRPPRQQRRGWFGQFIRRSLPGFILDRLLSFPADRQRGLADELDRVSRNPSLSDEAQEILRDGASRSRAAPTPREPGEIRDEM
ncbi:hypothetical protein ACG74X_20620 [Marivita sp. S0852]|uniref:hypothetical protein n=1 Tax=Marivita sp. S0852 TaxID=3373893 RepID=UPI0039821550